MEKLVSVIVPVYNVEKYLNRCVDSIINQTYKNLEIILIDDGSTDNSGTICDKYADKDNRIKVIHKKNGGLSSARNAGLDVFNGDYVTFIDSDDYYGEKAIEMLAKAIESGDYVFSCIKANIVTDDTVVKLQTEDTKKISKLSTKDYAKLMFQKKIGESVWDKLFLSSIFNSVRFENGRLNEDFLCLSKILLEDGNVSIVDYAGYNYYMRNDSITHAAKKGLSKSVIDSVYNAVEIENLVREKKPEILSYIGVYTAYQARTVLLLMSKDQYGKEKDLVKFCREAIKRNKKYLKNSFMKFRDKMFCCLYLIFPKTTKCVSNLLVKRA